MQTQPDKAAPATGHVTLTNLGNLDIRFAYDPVVIAKVKTLSCRQYSSGPPKRWTAPATVDNIARLREWGFAIPAGVIKAYLEPEKPRKMPALDFGSLDTALEPFQKEGVRRIEALRGRALLADDPGLGKTPQCLAWLRLHPELRPVVIVCKATGKLVWQRIAKRGILPEGSTEYIPLLPDDRVQVIFGERNAEIDADVVIVNYDVLARVEDCPQCNGDGERGGIQCRACVGKGSTVRLRDDLAAIKPAVVVVDECQQIMNKDSQRSTATLTLAKTARHLLAVTASPIKRRPKQFFNILNALRADIFPSWWKYAQEFCGAKHNGYGWNFDGATNLDKLFAVLSEHVMIRRHKETVLGKLPLRRHVVPLEITNRGEYDAAAADFMSWLFAIGDDDRYNKAKRAEALVRMSTLMRMAAERKTDMVIEWIRDFLESEKKLIVFTMHTKLLDRIVAEFADIAVKLNGSSTARQRQEAEDRFQNDNKCRLFVGNSDAAGDTITLTAAEDVAFVELPKTPEDVKQNEGRAYGRMNDPHGINSWFLVAAGTIEEDRAEQLNIGARVVGAVLDGRAVDDGEDMIDLISKYKGGRK